MEFRLPLKKNAYILNLLLQYRIITKHLAYYLAEYGLLPTGYAHSSSDIVNLKFYKLIECDHLSQDCCNL